MTETPRPPSPARTTLTITWILALAWVVIAGAGGALSIPALVVIGQLCLPVAVVTLIVGLILRSAEKARKYAADNNAQATPPEGPKAEPTQPS